MRVAFVAVVRALIVAGRHRAESYRRGAVLNVADPNKAGEATLERFGHPSAGIVAAVPWRGSRCAPVDPQRRSINLRLFVNLRGCGAITTAARKVHCRAVP